MASDHAWWQNGIIYQIYPRSFQDSNEDGIGDLNGIRERLGYLEWLGVDAVWLSPIYPSPMADFGYDVSDYTDVHEMFGSLDDLLELRGELHRRGMKLILDLVPNHTSSEHPWFRESRSSRENAKRDWYIWKDPAPDGGPPTNWKSVFGGSAWEFDEHTGQYYYHAFLKEQPDLNWRNSEVRTAMFDVIRFWLDRGIDGFRIDVIWHMIKDDQFRDEPENPNYHPGESSTYDEVRHIYTTDRPEIHGLIAEMRSVIEEYEDRVMIGEIYLPIERLVTYYGNEGTGIHLPYNFQLILLPWDARKIDSAIHAYEALLPTWGWPNWVLGNHDKSRVATRVGSAQARVAAMLLLTLRGTPTIYYGDEIGMHDVPIPPDRIHDPVEKNMPGLGLGRDPQRTPMQWDGSRSWWLQWCGTVAADVRAIAGDQCGRAREGRSVDPSALPAPDRVTTPGAGASQRTVCATGGCGGCAGVRPKVGEAAIPDRAEPELDRTDLRSRRAASPWRNHSLHRSRSIGRSRESDPARRERGTAHRVAGLVGAKTRTPAFRPVFAEYRDSVGPIWRDIPCRPWAPCPVPCDS